MAPLHGNCLEQIELSLEIYFSNYQAMKQRLSWCGIATKELVLTSSGSQPGITQQSGLFKLLSSSFSGGITTGHEERGSGSIDSILLLQEPQLGLANGKLKKGFVD